MRQPKPIKNPRDPAEIGREYLARCGTMNDPTAIVLSTHLFTEHWINQILLKFCPQFDLTNFGTTGLTYSQKLHIAFSIGKLPNTLFQNLKKLNKLRNDIGHKIDFDFTKIDLSYHQTHPAFVLAEYKPAYNPTETQHYILNVVRAVCTLN
jgi:hypothetical protein